MKAKSVKTVPAWLPRMAWAVALAACLFTFVACEPEPAAGAPDAGMLNKIPSLEDPPDRLFARIQRTCWLDGDGMPTCWGWNSSEAMSDISKEPARQVFCSGPYCYRVSLDGMVSAFGVSWWTGEPYGPIDWLVPPAEAGVFTHVKSDQYACGVNTEGLLKCWGSPGDGGLAPTIDAPLHSVELGFKFGCVLHLDGRVQCWGDLPTLRQQPALNDVVQLAAGHAHICARRANGTVACWGSTAHGASDVPSDLAHVMSISAAGWSTCALIASGAVRCWGDNRDGQADVPTGLRASAIAAGGAHTCALTDDGGVTCWGDGAYGALWEPHLVFGEVFASRDLVCGRNGSRLSCWRTRVIPPLPLDGPVLPAFDVAPDSSLAIDADGGCEAQDLGNVRCWGRYAGSAVESAVDVDTVAFGAEACVLNRAQRVLCGRGGELVEAATDVERLEAFPWGTCAVHLDGHASCWERRKRLSVPPVVAPVDFARLDGVMCVTDAAGEVSCIDEDGQPRANPLGDGAFRRIASSVGVMCGQRRDGTLVCVGDDFQGVLNPPAQLPKIRRLLMLEYAVCAHLESGEVKCWGEVYR